MLPAMLRPRSTAASVLTPGNHDGVHVGHQALVRRACELAAERGAEPTAMFFDPHPTAVLTPERAPRLLTTPTRRTELLVRAGCARSVVLPFTPAFAETTPREFVERVVVAECNAVAVVIGPDFHFGRRRAGNVDTLRELGVEYGYDVHVVPPVVVDGEPASSTRIRRALEAGDVAAARAMLGRAHDVTGTVVHGDARGRTLGFPTANLDALEGFVPLDGVYAVRVRRLDRPGAPLLDGVLNLGARPTVGRDRSFEVFLFDFDEAIYGERLRVAFVARLRAVQRFEGVEALVAGIRKDVEAARAALAQTDVEVTRWL